MGKVWYFKGREPLWFLIQCCVSWMIDLWQLAGRCIAFEQSHPIYGCPILSLPLSRHDWFGLALIWHGFTFWFAQWRPDDDLSDLILDLNGLTWFFNIMTWNSLFLHYSLYWIAWYTLSLVFKMFHWYYFGDMWGNEEQVTALCDT